MLFNCSTTHYTVIAALQKIVMLWIRCGFCSRITDVSFQIESFCIYSGFFWTHSKHSRSELQHLHSVHRKRPSASTIRFSDGSNSKRSHRRHLAGEHKKGLRSRLYKRLLPDQTVAHASKKVGSHENPF